jgi:tetratricopeptide (TPR) repeat protein
MNTTASSRIFISYSHRGNGLAWKQRLFAALAVFEKQHLLDPWHDDQTKLGENWHVRINAAMKDARLAILLLTDEFLKSPFVLQHELPELQRRHKEEGLIIAPILCEPCGWPQNEWLASLQIKPRVQTDPTPLATFSEAEAVCVLRQLATDIAEEISRAALVDLPIPDQPPPPAHVYLDKFPLTRGPGQREERLIGREQELALLDLAFAQPHTAVVSLVAWGGVGKTMLVQHWLQRLQREGWFGARRVYAWSFYSQGTKEDRQASEDTFLAHALEWFGVQCEPTLSPWDKGHLLADAVARERTLLILDGIEPLQYPPGPMGGQLRAPGVQSLLKQLARKAGIEARSQKPEVSNCLCLVTTREPLADLADFQRRPDAVWGSVLRVDLGNLTEEAGAALLHHAGAKRAGAADVKADDAELLAASREVDGHALTLNLLGRFLARAHGGDIRRRDLVKFEEADRKEQGGTTFKMLATFENWFARSGEFGARQLAVLRMLGLFDRPADAGSIAALRKPPVIAGLTDPLFTTRLDSSTGRATVQPLVQEEWNTTTSFLADFGLLLLQSDDARASLIDCHPLIREHFGSRLKFRIESAWQSGHQRIYEYLANFNSETSDLTIEEAQRLYEAVAHGFETTKAENALSEVYRKRIERGDEAYSTKRLGLYSLDLDSVAHAFEVYWKQPKRILSPFAQLGVLNRAGQDLTSLGRLEEAFEPMRAAVALAATLKELTNPKSRAFTSATLSTLEMYLGRVQEAVRDGRSCVTELTAFVQNNYSDVVSRDLGNLLMNFTVLAEALHQSGHRDEALTLFDAAGQIQAHDPQHPQLYSIQGWRYWDLLLSMPEAAAWRTVLRSSWPGSSQEPTNDLFQNLKACGSVVDRADKATITAKEMGSGRDAALGSIAIGRAIIMRYTLDSNGNYQRAYDSGFDRVSNLVTTMWGVPLIMSLLIAQDLLTSAVGALRLAGHQPVVPNGYLARAWGLTLKRDYAGAKADLDEAWDIAERGPMRLHLADIHLYRARLFFREKNYPWKSPQADLAAAEKLINDCGYHRRDEELADAKRAVLGP